MYYKLVQFGFISAHRYDTYIIDYYIHSNFLRMQTTFNTRMQNITIMVHSCLRNIFLKDNLYKQKGEWNKFNTTLKSEKLLLTKHGIKLCVPFLLVTLYRVYRF